MTVTVKLIERKFELLGPSVLLLLYTIRSCYESIDEISSYLHQSYAVKETGLVDDAAK